MSDHDTFGTTQTFKSSINNVECPCCHSIVDAQRLKCLYWGFTYHKEGVECNVCSTMIAVGSSLDPRR